MIWLTIIGALLIGVTLGYVAGALVSVGTRNDDHEDHGLARVRELEAHIRELEAHLRHLEADLPAMHDRETTSRERTPPSPFRHVRG